MEVYLVYALDMVEYDNQVYLDTIRIFSTQDKAVVYINSLLEQGFNFRTGYCRPVVLEKYKLDDMEDLGEEIEYNSEN